MENWGLPDCASISMDSLPALTSQLFLSHHSNRSVCPGDRNISNVFSFCIFQSRRKQSYSLVSLLWKKLLHKLCTYYSPGLRYIINVPVPEKAFIGAVFLPDTWEFSPKIQAASISRLVLLLIRRKVLEPPRHPSPHACGSTRAYRQNILWQICCMGCAVEPQ